ncbi:MAG: class I SAM-dependent methyltransferase [Planctomycetota bacterium]|jgi:SAM-dependent methyltransferase
MADRGDKAYLQPYRQAVERYGAGFEATLWNSPEAQALRFDVMIGLLDLDGRAVLDVGCGQGDLAARLLEQRVPFARYVGVDAVAEMIEAAGARRLERCEFICRDAVADPEVLSSAEPDCVCISGTLNTMDEPTARRLVGAAFAAASRAVVFNFLSSRAHPRWADRDPAPARRFDPVRWLDFALGLSSRVTFDQAYFDGHDATILIEHDADPSGRA